VRKPRLTEGKEDGDGIVGVLGLESYVNHVGEPVGGLLRNVIRKQL